MLDIVGDKPTVTPLMVLSSSDTQTMESPTTSATTEQQIELETVEHNLEPASTVPTQRTTPERRTSSKRRKRPNEAVEWLEAYNSKRQREEERKVEILQTMHQEKLQRMDRLIDVLQSLKK